MLTNFSPAAETRWHDQLKPYLGKTGKVVALCGLENTDLGQPFSAHALVQFSDQTLVLPLYEPATLDYKIGQTLRVQIARKLVTIDERNIYTLVARPA